MPSRKELANSIRALSMDAVEKAKSGHPGAPLGMADMAEVLWNDFLKHNPSDPQWYDRDRFVLSNGHASMLLYSLLYLSGYDISIKDIKDFRQLHSKTPGHPEYGVTPGVNMTTGPLGQGLASAVGMALAEKMLAAEFNRENFSIVDHFTYVFLGDGCLMEGLSHEACSFAGTLGLGKLIALWDNNGISIDGSVDGWFTDNTPDRFKAYGWHVIENIDGHDPVAVKKAIAKARKETEKPSLICCKTTIGFGAPQVGGTAKAHGSPLGEDEINATRRILNWSYPPFEIPIEIKSAWDARKKGKKAQSAWDTLLASYSEAYPELAAEFSRRMQANLPQKWEEKFSELLISNQKKKNTLATRASSKQTLEQIAPELPELIGGAADLSGSVGTLWDKSSFNLASNPVPRHIEYGVREFAMGAIMNGLAVHGGFIPYGGTFLVFSDYAKSAIRMSSLMKQQVIWVLSHDSIMVGEDGPTHQPIEQLSMLRTIPGVHVWRPCDSVEVVAAWRSAIERRDGPTCIILSRQDIPASPRDTKTLENINRGGYILKESKGLPDIIFIATGSEVPLALAAAETLEKRDKKVRVVSMPCPEIYDKQTREWKESVLPHNVRARVAIEASTSDWWRKYVGLDGGVVGIDTFGESGPGKAIYEYFGFTVENILKVAKFAEQCGVRCEL